nr:unnamed protein product [Callosobruchus analis]
MSDWDTVTVLKKRAPKASAMKSEQAVNAARRQGLAVETQAKWGAGSNKQHVTTKNTAKLDRETEELKHDTIPLDVGKLIQQGRQAKGLSQKDLATKINEKPQDFLAFFIKTLAKWGFGLSRKEILELVGDFVCKNDIKTPFKNGLPGEDWFLNFKKRHNLSIRKPEPLEYARKKAATDPFIIYGYFNLLKKTLVEMDLENAPDRIWNLDESYLSIDPSKSKVVGERGQKSSRVISSSGRENTTLVLACSATGQRVPPLIIFKGKNIWDQWKAPPDKEFPGTAYAATPNGWMETKIFKTYFEKTLVPALGDRRPVLVIYDGHSTHVSLDLIEYAKDQGITILKLPAHTSDILQPLDVCVFKSYKDKWDQTVATWQRQHIGQKLPKSLFSQFLGETWTTVIEDVIRNGFRKACIFPFNTDVVPKENFSKDAIERWEKHQRQSDGNVITDYEAGRGVPNNIIIGKIERVIGLKLRGKDRGKPLLPPGAKKNSTAMKCFFMFSSMVGNLKLYCHHKYPKANECEQLLDGVSNN